MVDILRILADIFSKSPSPQKQEDLLRMLQDFCSSITEGIDGFLPEEIKLMHERKRVLAIKAYRDNHGCPLLDAKDKVDEYMKANGIRP